VVLDGAWPIGMIRKPQELRVQGLKRSGGRMDWFFDGLGTLLIGLLIGGAGGGAAGWHLNSRRTVQNQKARDAAQQVQAGRDVRH
jgi:hypothetical protein